MINKIFEFIAGVLVVGLVIWFLFWVFSFIGIILLFVMGVVLVSIVLAVLCGGKINIVNYQTEKRTVKRSKTNDRHK